MVLLDNEKITHHNSCILCGAPLDTGRIRAAERNEEYAVCRQCIPRLPPWNKGKTLQKDSKSVVSKLAGKNPMYRKTLPQSSKDKQSASLKQYYGNRTQEEKNARSLKSSEAAKIQRDNRIGWFSD